MYRFISLSFVATAVVASLSGCTFSVSADPSAGTTSCALSAVRFYPVQTDANGQKVRQLDGAIQTDGFNVNEISAIRFTAYDMTDKKKLTGAGGSPALLPVGHMIHIDVDAKLSNGTIITCTPREVRVPDADTTSTPSASQAAA